MLRYVLKRLLISLPTLFIISLAVFGLSKCAPGDPVENVFGEDPTNYTNPLARAETYRRHAVELGIDKPVFYGRLSTAAFPDTLWKIFPLDRRERLTKLTAQNGNWSAVHAYENALHQALIAIENLPDSLQQKVWIRLGLVELYAQDKLDKLESVLQPTIAACQTLPPTFSTFTATIQALAEKTSAACLEKKPSKLIIPAIHWYGFNNQYHHWLTGFVTGDLGLTKKKLPIWKELKPALYASMAINLIAIFFAYLISIPLGVEMARRKGGLLDRWVQRALVFLHAMPLFWVGGLLVILFCSPIIGKPLIENPYLDILDAWDMEKEPFLDWFSNKLPKFVLPILVLTLYSLTIVTLQMRGGMIETLGQDYIRTARAKGVSEEDIHWTHAFRNALFPVITIFSSMFPALFTGSLVLETLFNFPGMGQKAQSAFLDQDLGVLSIILMAAAIMTILGNLIADLLYGLADPRVRLSSRR